MPDIKIKQKAIVLNDESVLDEALAEGWYYIAHINRPVGNPVVIVEKPHEHKDPFDGKS